MPASPVHHTPIDATKAWDGPAAEKAFDKVKGDFVKFYAWVDEGESDADADGTDKEDGWGPHHDVSDTGVPGDANQKGFEAAMAALNGAHGKKSVIPAGDRQAVWDHLAAHYKDAGVKASDIPALSEVNSRRDRWDAVRRAHPPVTPGERRDDSMSFGDQQSLVYQALCARLGNDAEDDAGDVDFWIQDLSTDWVVYHVYGGDNLGNWKLSYSLDADNVVTFSGDPVAVVEKTEYVPAPAETNAQRPKGTVFRCGRCAARFALLTPLAVSRDSGSDADLEGDNDDEMIPNLELLNGDAGPGTASPLSGGTIVCPQCAGVGSVPGNTDGTPHPLGDGDDDADDVTFYPLDPAKEGTAEDYPFSPASDDSAATWSSGPSSGNENYMPMGANSKSAPKENLVRTRRSGPGAPSVLLRDATTTGSAESGTVMFGYFSTYGELYEIDSWYEGNFLEQIAFGAFGQTMSQDRSGMRVLYDHGFDPQLGNKPLGPITALEERAVGAYYEVPLLDTDYNRNFVLPALRGQLMSGESVGSQLGSSFRFVVTGEEWDRSETVTASNPKGLPIRTITQAQVMEFGPVTFPANESATAGIRSATDTFIDRLYRDRSALARFTERTSFKVVQPLISAADYRHRNTKKDAPSTTSVKQTETERDDVRRARVKQLRRKAALAIATDPTKEK